MKSLFAAMLGIALAAAAIAPASADERLGDAALGALAGAVVLGPIGAIAGGAVGYTTGPDIAGSWGLRHHAHHHHARQADRRDQ